jgi:hypothetical protein
MAFQGRPIVIASSFVGESFGYVTAGTARNSSFVLVPCFGCAVVGTSTMGAIATGMGMLHDTLVGIARRSLRFGSLG